ncbi:MAG TPA: hypothetical protein VKN14_02430 [Flavobacteriaceae bacterium]|nr:hypothetical protein [Flavobacteriaceae bacterium]
MENQGQNITGKGTSTEQSKFDKFFGQHFKSMVVGILIVILIITFTIIFCVKDSLSSDVVTFFSSAVMGLIGFFAGSSSK